MDDELRARLASALTPLSALVHEGVAEAIVVCSSGGMEVLRFGDPTVHIPGPAFGVPEREYSVITDEPPGLHAWVWNFSGMLLTILFEEESDLGRVRAEGERAAEAVRSVVGRHSRR